MMTEPIASTSSTSSRAATAPTTEHAQREHAVRRAIEDLLTRQMEHDAAVLQLQVEWEQLEALLVQQAQFDRPASSCL